ncbi:MULTISPECIES: PEPxxWA-CTERM sorting domain-containing protein [Sphingomonas]|uniref:Npun_F0296 family exosortase-dependent surface protein n=1 Tax=Sphingomonas TaxID=13687 RepID=UPI0013B383C9|nr:MULTISPECIES: PEPxxWA-CTERM sorting domain-containing protein [Sphingomonas]
MMPKLTFAAAALATLAIAAPASAAVSLGVTPGSATYTGPTPTINFDSGRPSNVTGGSIVSGTASPHAQPLGSTGGYFSVGPADGSPGVINLSSYSQLFNISFIWGSVDSYNTLELINSAGVALYTFTGADIFNPANGNQTSANTNPLVTIFLTGADTTAVRGLRFSSTQNAFETDNFAINAVPEPSTWALMLVGFGAVGFSMRRGRRATPRLSAMA